ncbi:rod shape-determining protein MreC [uncultured Tenacibaculum sp.]|uniref:rod shape-determining protein MreC n=1 Tax=uncultured Tenacibaculum sp. TaxID=174713 RepID=UPI00262EBBE7|nr:rod shape-determining protein MreC [uncultured Tenacibaculum sp.]
MQQLFYFLRKFKYFLFFIFLEIIAVALIINNHSFHRSKFISSTNSFTGNLSQKRANISEYFNLKNENQLLSEENNRLKNLLEVYLKGNDSIVDQQISDSLNNQNYKYLNGKVIINDYLTPDNFITINRGTKAGVQKEMAVVNSKGVIGIIDNVSGNFARVQSILNSKSRINAGFKNNNHYGTLKWDGKDYTTVQLTDIPRQAQFKAGDTVVTGGKSTIFPKGILIGTVVSVPEKVTAVNTINIKLFNDMTNLGYVNIINNLNKEEIKILNSTNE